MSELARIKLQGTFNSNRRWMGYVVFCLLAAGGAYLVAAEGSKAGLALAAVSLGLIWLIGCLRDIRVGFYGMIAFGFLTAFIDRAVNADLPLDMLLFLLPPLLFAVILIKSLHQERKKWMMWHPLVGMFLLLMAYTVIQVFNPSMFSFAGWLSYFRGFMSFFLTMTVLMYILKDLGDVRMFFKLILGMIFITALYGCYQQWVGFASFESRWIYSRPGAYALFSLPGGQMRRFSFLSDPANFGTLMATGGLGTLLLTFGPFGKRKKIILGVMTLFILLGMSYSGTRTSNIMLGAGLALYILMTIYKKSTRIMAGCALMVFLFILYAPIYGNVTLNRMRSAFRPTKDASYDVRNIHRHRMQPYMYSHPFGGGVNTTMGAGVKYNPDHVLAGFPPDSTYFKIALEQGWTGLALQCAFLFTILFYAIHYFYKCRDKEIVTYYAAITVMLFSMILGGFTQFTFNSPPQNFIFYSMIALIIKLHTFDSSINRDLPITNNL